MTEEVTLSELRVEGECLQTWSETLSADPGTYVIGRGELEAHDEAVDTSCAATLSVFRRRAGELDPGYGEGGVIRGVQVRRVEFVSAP